jgi:hypothetical protein
MSVNQTTTTTGGTDTLTGERADLVEVLRRHRAFLRTPRPTASPTTRPGSGPR